VTPRERAVQQAVEAFGGVGYSRLWDALVDALERIEKARDEVDLLETFENQAAPRVTAIVRRFRKALE
jgi:hypothetical protein